MAQEQEWLSSQRRLCELQAGVRSDCAKMPPGRVQVTVNCQSYPPPAYSKCSVLSSLNIYNQALLEAAGRAPVGLRSSGLEGFAQVLTESILQSVWHHWKVGEPGREQHCAQREEANADLSSRIRAPPQGHALSITQAGNPPMETLWEAGVDGTTMAYEETNLCPALIHSGLPSEGSIDYPSAPPTSPLLPETVRSPRGFSRSLKQGLANGFRPSPPPPTPKDPSSSAQGSPVIAEDKEDFVERLMRSLSLECMKDERSGSPVKMDWTARSGTGQLAVATVSNYADWLSAEILGWLTVHNAQQSGDPGGAPGELCIESPTMHMSCTLKTCVSASLEAEGSQATGSGAGTLHAWAEREVEAALLEAAPKQNKMPEGSRLSASRQPVDAAPCGGTPEPSGQHMCGSRVESLEEFAEALVAEVLQQAGLSRPLNKDQESCCEAELRTAPEPRTHICLEPQTLSSTKPYCSDPGSHSGPLASQYGSFATELAETVLRSSVLEATKLHQGLAGAEVRLLLGSWRHRGTRTLQALLLWAAASHLDTSILELPHSHEELHTELSSLAQQARLTGWTVGDLVASVLRFCGHERRTTDEGLDVIDRSLLESLQKQLAEAAEQDERLLPADPSQQQEAANELD